MNPDGSSPELLIGYEGDARFVYSGLDWQPLPVNTPSTYPRPKGATPSMYLSLVPAYKPCTAPNRTHGPPLAFGSCNPPQPGSTYLTVGVGDGSPALARSIGSRAHGRAGRRAGPTRGLRRAIRFSLTNVMQRLATSPSTRASCAAS